MQYLDSMDISKSPFLKFYTCITAELKVIKLLYYIEHARKLLSFTFSFSLLVYVKPKELGCLFIYKITNYHPNI